MEKSGNSSHLAMLAQLSVKAARGIGIVLLIYLLALAAYGYYQYDGTRSRLLTYGLTNATATLIASAVLLVAFSIPAFSIFRIIASRGKPVDYAFALVLPLVSWATSLIPANFDATSGKVLRFCAERFDGSMFCLDHEGIDLVTRRTLMPMDEKSAELEFRREKGLAPKAVTEDIARIVFFDPLNGRAKIFFARSESGCFDLFDNPGIDSRSGDKLVPATKDLITQLKVCRRAGFTQPAQPAATVQTPAELPRVAPSFDCLKASWKSEHIICSSRALAVLDLALSNAFREAIARSPDRTAELRSSQNRWLRMSREACDDVPCLRELYEARIAELGKT